MGLSHEEVNSSCGMPLFCCLFQRNIQTIRLFLTFCLKKRRPPLTCLFGVLNLLNLCALLYLKQMCSGFPVLDFLMQFPDIMCYRQQNTLPFYIRFSTVSESSKACILFQISKASLRLDTPVNTQQYPLFTGNPLQVFLPVLVELSGNIQIFHPVFEWNFTVVPFDTFSFVGTSAAVFTTVYGRFPFISCFGFFFLFVSSRRRRESIFSILCYILCMFMLFCILLCAPLSIPAQSAETPRSA